MKPTWDTFGEFIGAMLFMMPIILPQFLDPRSFLVMWGAISGLTILIMLIIDPFKHAGGKPSQ